MEYIWISKLLGDLRTRCMSVERAIMLAKKVTYFGEIAYLNSSCIKKSIILMFLSSSRNKFKLLWQNSVTDISVGFRPPCWCLSGWAATWRLHPQIAINLGEKILRISWLRLIAVTWILARVFAYLPSQFLFRRIYLEWSDTENQQLIDKLADCLHKLTREKAGN